MNQLLERRKLPKPNRSRRPVRLWICDSAVKKALLLGQPILWMVAILNSPLFGMIAFRENRSLGNLGKITAEQAQEQIQKPKQKSKIF